MGHAFLARFWVLLPMLAISTLPACQSVEAALDATDKWETRTLSRPFFASPPAARPAPVRTVEPAPVAATTMVEGSGRFIGEPATGSAPTANDNDGNITLNLANVPTAQAAKSVLGDILAVKYTVDPAVQGNITLQTPRPVTKAAAVDLFQAALLANNAVIVNKNGVYQIKPADQASVGARLNVDGPYGEQVGSRLQVVQLKYVAASEMRRVLEPIAPRGGIVQTDDARNLITLSGNRQDISAMMEAIGLFDIDVLKGMSFAIVPVQISRPDAIADELKTVFASDRQGPMAGMVRFLPNKRLSSILVISPQPRYLREAESWIRRLDAQARGNEKQVFTYTVQNRRAQELVEILQTMFSNEAGAGGAGGSGRSVAPNYSEAKVQSAPTKPSSGFSFGASGAGSAGTPQPAMPATAPVTTASVTTTQAAGDGLNDGSQIKIAADDAENTLLIEATNRDYQRVLQAITSLDIMPKQVLIDATIAEVSLNDDLRFGVRWYLESKNSAVTFTDAISGSVGAVYPGFSYALKAASITATINALADITNVNVVSSPSLTVRDNKAALLQIGDQVPITTQSATSTLAAGAPVVNSVSYKDTGVILSITPRINKNGRVLLDIEQEVSSVVRTTSSDIDSPTIRQRRIKTSVAVNDGETLVLGGMIQENNTKSRAQIPLLGDIPFIGNAAKYKDDQISKTELIIVISPHVMRNVYEARRVTDEYRKVIADSILRDRAIARDFKRSAKRILD